MDHFNEIVQNVVLASPYIQAWLVYLGGVIGCLLVFWRMTESTWPFLQLFLRAIVATLLLMPIRLVPGEDYWVPTTIFVLMKTVTHEFAAAMPGIRQLLLVAVVLVVASWIVHGIRRFRAS
jgi:hypothetical protein